MEPQTLTDKQRLRLIYSLRDFNIANSALIFLGECEPKEHYSRVEMRRFRCYHDTAIISYWQPFSKSPSIPALDFSWIGVEPTTKEQQLHDFMKTLRDKTVAHSDSDFMRFSFHELDVKLGDIRFPYLDTDDGLDVVNIRDELLDWVRKIIGSIGLILFNIAQIMELGSHYSKFGEIPKCPGSD